MYQLQWFKDRACYFLTLEDIHDLCQSPGFRAGITEP